MASTNMLKVYYIGPKPKKVDNVSSAKNRKQRVWRGFGDSLQIPEGEAHELFRFDTIWADDAGFKAAKAKRDAAAQAQEIEMIERANRSKARRLARAPDPDEGDEAEEIEEHRTPGQSTDTQENGEQDQDREALIQGAILSLNPESLEDYTSTGAPRVTRVSTIVGTNVAADEIEDAVKRLRAAGKLKPAN